MSVMLHLNPAVVTSYRQAARPEELNFMAASLLWPWRQRVRRVRWTSSASKDGGRAKAAAPPSAVVRFLTA